LAILIGALSLVTAASARLGFTLTLTATPTSGMTGTTATITAVANKPLAGRTYINIWQVGRRGVLKTCRTKRCSVVVTPPGAGPSPAPSTTYTTYRAQISMVRRRHVPFVRAWANARVTVGRTSPHCVPSTCPTM
jgi:hypothetical protein